MEIVKLGFICIVGILLAVPLKSYKAEYGVYMGIAVCIVVFGYAAQYFAGILSAMEQLRGYVEEYGLVLARAANLPEEEKARFVPEEDLHRYKMLVSAQV